MQNVVIDKPYEFVPPVHADIWPALIKLYLRRYLRKKWRIDSAECRGAEHLAASVRAGHGIILTPNHCRLSDPLVLGFLAKKIGINLYAMASWHTFHEDWFTKFMIRRMGAFSVYREGMDRQAINTAVDLIVQARRPLVIFPEGAISRHNDRLMPLMDGVALIARTAAKRKAKQDPPKNTVIHPVAIRYFFHGDLVEEVGPTLGRLEARLTWRPKTHLSVVERLRALGRALLALKEVEYLGNAQTGRLFDRVESLIEEILRPLEEEWKIRERAESVVGRVKNLRTAILPDMVQDKVSPEERERRWQQLAACYYAQQLSHYPRDYIAPEGATMDRVLETVERMEEDLTDKYHPHGPTHVVLQVGEAILVELDEDRRAESERIMDGIKTKLQSMLDELATESRPFVAELTEFS
jgi:1-acyl-sn-glycerol-3-phosphate acyltransferase